MVLCAHPRSAAASAEPGVQFYDGGFECYAGPLALQLPDTYSQLLQLGKVVAAHELRRQSERGLTTVERQVDLQGLRLRVYLYSGDVGHYQVQSVHITSARWQLASLRVGESVDAVRLEPGWPALPRAGAWEVQGDSAHLRVQVRSGRIAAVDYVCASDP